MPHPSSRWESLKRARVVQVLAVYLGASWVVLQIADTLVDALALPAWVVPVCLILLMVGLVVILATAWIQSLPDTTAREESGELPTDWQIAPRDALASLRRGRMPHLTWGRSVAGGVVVLTLVFLGAGTYMGFTRGSGPSFGPARALASEAADGIAVVPFEVRGQDLEIWREGMMDLLANGLDGVGGFRTIDSRTVMARWQQRVGDGGYADLDATLGVAREVGARYALEGSVVGLGSNVRLVANVYDLETGREVATGQTEGPSEDVLRLVDELAVGTMRSLLMNTGRSGTGDFSAETITTASLPALRAFLEGETHYRKGRFADAVQSYELAVAADSTFAMALVRLSEAYGWLESAESQMMIDVGERAIAQAHRLSPRYQFIMEGWDALNRRTAEGLESLKEAVRKYPDDPEAWFLLAETYLHVGGATYGTDDELWDALQRATSLDPNFAPYLVHVAEFAVLRGDRELAEGTIDRYEAITGSRQGFEHVEIAIPLLLGTEEESAAALESAREAPVRALELYNGTFHNRHDDADLDATIVDVLLARTSNPQASGIAARLLAGMGQVERGIDLMESAEVAPASQAMFWAHAYELWNVEPPQSTDPAVFSAAACDDPEFVRTCHLNVGVAAARLGRWNVHGAVLSRLREYAAGPEAESDPDLRMHVLRIADVVEGVGAARRGEERRARELLGRHASTYTPAGERARLELGWLAAEGGRPTEALRQFLSLRDLPERPLAMYGAAMMHEQLGRPDEALRYWASLARITRDGDPLPRIVEARQAVARLSGERAGAR